MNKKLPAKSADMSEDIFMYEFKLGIQAQLNILIKVGRDKIGSPDTLPYFILLTLLFLTGLMHIIAINSDQYCSHYFPYHVEVKKIRESLFIPDSILWNGNSHLVKKC